MFPEIEDIYRGILYRVMFNPVCAFRCAYIKVPYANWCKTTCSVDDAVLLHGGCTYLERTFPEQSSDAADPSYMIVGWDYGHLNDGIDKATLSQVDPERYAIMQRNPHLFLDTGEHVWTQKEVIDEIHSVIDTLLDTPITYV